jgi:hypothetical protein
MLVRLNQLKKDHELIYHHLETLRRVALIFQLGENHRAEALERWRQSTTPLREAVDFFTHVAPKHFDIEANLCAQVAHSPRCIKDMRELELDQFALGGLCNRALAPVKSWLMQLRVPTRIDAEIFLGLLDELKIHLDRHIDLAEHRVFPELESFVNASRTPPKQSA